MNKEDTISSFIEKGVSCLSSSIMPSMSVDTIKNRVNKLGMKVVDVCIHDFEPLVDTHMYMQAQRVLNKGLKQVLIVTELQDATPSEFYQIGDIVKHGKITVFAQTRSVERIPKELLEKLEII